MVVRGKGAIYKSIRVKKRRRKHPGALVCFFLSKTNHCLMRNMKKDEKNNDDGIV